MEVTTVVEILGIEAIEFYSTVVVLQCRYVFLQGAQCISSVVIVVGFEGVQIDGLFEWSKGLLILFHF